MTNKVKPFYIRITDDMTPQMVQDAFDKCVDAGAVGFEGVQQTERKNNYAHCYSSDFYYFGVNDENCTFLSHKQKLFGESTKEITLDQLDEWLGLEVEQGWRNGDECQHKNGFIFTFIGKCDNPEGFDCVLMDDSGNAVLSFVNELSKPETPEQKAERERLEAAYDLYCHVSEEANRGTYTFEQFCNESLTDYKVDYLSIVDKTNYRKQ